MGFIENIYISIFIFLIGTAIGSFLNVLSDRLPQEKSILGRSHCDFCGHILAWYDLFPLFSFIFLKRKCRYCGKKLSFYYLTVEIVTGIAFVLTWNFLPIFDQGNTESLGLIRPQISNYEFGSISSLFFHSILVKVIFLGIVSSLIVIIFADAKFQIIPDSMHVVLVILGLMLHTLAYVTAVPPESYAVYLGRFIIAAILVMIPLLLLFILTKGRGMGFGDVKLAFVIGFLFGLKGGLVVLYLSFIFGALLGLILLSKGRKKLKSKIAFGPFLVLGMLMIIFFKAYIFELIQRVWGV